MIKSDHARSIDDRIMITIDRSIDQSITNLITLSDLFYDYTIGTTIINIFISLLIFGLSQRKRLLPPHRILIHISKRINRLLFCCTKDPIIDSSEIDSAWTSCFMALNALMNSVILISYLIGVLIVFIG